MSASFQQSVLVVVERDAACFYWMDEWGAAPEDGWCMLEREENEVPRSFSDRLQTTLARQAPDPSSSEVVVLVLGRSVDPRSMAERRELAATLLAHLVRIGGGSLVLARGYASGDDGAHALSGFAADLTEEWEGSGARVIIRLGRLPAASPANLAKSGADRESAPVAAE